MPLHLDFGTSFVYKTRDVSDILKQTFPISLQLGLTAMVLAIVVGTLLGTLAAINQNSTIDYISAGIAVLGTSLPNFVIAVLLVLVFSLTLKWLPPDRVGDVAAEDADLADVGASSIPHRDDHALHPRQHGRCDPV